MSVIAEALIRLGFAADAKPIDDIEKKAKDSAGKVANAWERATGSINKNLIALAAGLAPGAVIGGIVALTEKAAAQGDVIAKTARTVGTAADEYQRLTFSAGRSGASLEHLGVGIKFLNKNMTDARLGGAQPFVDALELIGLTTEDLRGSSEENIGVIADRLMAVADEGTRSALAMRIFGESGTKLASLLESGSAGIKQMGDEAERLGLVLGKDALDASEQFTDSISDAKSVLSAFFTIIGTSVAPAVRAIVEDVKEWTVANRRLVTTNVVGFITGLTNAFSGMIPVATSAFELVTDFFDLMEKHSGGPDQLALSLGGLAIAVGSLTGPVGALGAALGVVLLNLDRISRAADASYSAFDQLLDLFGIDIGLSRTQAQIESNVLHGGETRLRGQAAVALTQYRQGFRGRASDTLSRLSAQQLAEIAASSKDPKFKDFVRGIQEAVAAGEKSEKSLQAAEFERKQRALLASKKQREHAAIDFDASVFEFDEVLGDDIRRVAGRYGLGEVAIDQALRSGAASMTEGATLAVAREAALSRLGSLAGRDLSGRTGADPLLSALLGDEGVPDVPLSAITKDVEPQVLVSNIYNTFNFESDFNITSAGGAIDTANETARVLFDFFSTAVGQSTNLVKVRRAR